MTKDEYERGLELQGYRKSIEDMTLGDIALKFLKEHHLPKFLKTILVKFTHPLLLLKEVDLVKANKENTELTETLKTYNGCGDWDNDFHTCRVYLQHEELQMYINQLTKATALLKKFIETSNPIYFDEDRQKVKVQAEQFIREIEK